MVDAKYEERLIRVHHVGVFYKILSYSNEIRKDIELDNQNDDSLSAEFYVTKENLSAIAILELEKLGYALSKG